MYRVYLLEDIDVNNFKELDCEGVDFTTIFSVADVADIANRKDNITKQIDFKGTKNNNEAFGSFFHLNRTSDLTLDNKLFFNYNPVRIVTSLIYEDGILLFKGSLRVMGISVDTNSNITYQTVSTGTLIDFKQVISDKYLSDLDFSDLKHQYTWTNISNSWGTSTLRYNPTTALYATVPFQKGSGYVYPFIDYGYIFGLGITANDNISAANNDKSKINLPNFQPAVYAKEYFDRIFNQPELASFSYEVKGSPELIERFNSLIIPNNTEKIIENAGTQLNTRVYNTNANIVHDHNKDEFDDNYLARAIDLPFGLSVDASKNLFQPYGSYRGGSSSVFVVNRTFTSNGYVRVKFNSLESKYTNQKKVNVQLCERPSVAVGTGFEDANSWKVVASNSLRINPNVVVTNQVLEFEVGEKTFDAGSQLLVRLFVDEGLFETAEVFNETGYYFFRYNIAEGELRFPKNTTSLIAFEVKDGDAFTPKPIDGIKQIDFIKSIISLFNFYVYAEKENSKKLIFQSYDDYYAFALPIYLKNSAIDWTNKIDYSSGFKVKSNLEIPKNYIFSMKDDSDFINANYKKNYSETYGTFRFTDSFGITDQKKLDVLFSPSPLVEYLGTGRVHPAIYIVDGNNKKPVKSNIRILYYNGVKSCTSYTIAKDVNLSTGPSTSIVAANITTYPQTGNYFLATGLSNMTPKSDLYFGLAKEMYFGFTTLHQNAPTAYNLYYIGQTSDLTNPNVAFIDCEAYLNETDIGNLDLRVPVFIDMGALGHAYFKILNVEYTKNTSTSRVSLQKIAIV